MCDGTSCPCNLYPPGHPDSRWPNGRPARPARAPGVRRAAVRIVVGECVLVVVLAFLAAMTGWAFLDVLGQVAVGGVLLAFVVAVVAGLCEVGPKVAARHRSAVERAGRD